MAAYDQAAMDARRKSQALANVLAGEPDVPAAPEQAFPGLSAGGRALARGGTFGAMAGGALGGVPGALAGAAIGAGINRLRMGTPSGEARAALDAGWDGFGGQPSTPAASASPNAAGPSGTQRPSELRPGDYGHSPNVVGYNGGVSANLDTMQGAKADPWAGMRQKTAPPTPAAEPSMSLDDALRAGFRAIFR